MAYHPILHPITPIAHSDERCKLPDKRCNTSNIEPALPSPVPSSAWNAVVSLSQRRTARLMAYPCAGIAAYGIACRASGDDLAWRNWALHPCRSKSPLHDCRVRSAGSRSPCPAYRNATLKHSL